MLVELVSVLSVQPLENQVRMEVVSLFLSFVIYMHGNSDVECLVCSLIVPEVDSEVGKSKEIY